MGVSRPLSLSVAGGLTPLIVGGRLTPTQPSPIEGEG